MHEKRIERHPLKVAGGLLVVTALALGIAVYLLGRPLGSETTQPGEQGMQASAAAPAVAPIAANGAADAASSALVLPGSDRRGEVAVEMRKHVGKYQQLLADRPIFPRARQVGYGSFIDQAIASADPELLAEAAALIRKCKSQDVLVEGLRSHLHSSQGSSQQFSGANLQAEEDVQRRCQALTDAQKAQYLPLLEAAAKAGAPGAASQFHAALLDAAGDPATYPWLLDGLVADANRGDGVAINALACGSLGSSLPMTQRAAYFAALEAFAARSDGSEVAYKFMVQYCGRRPTAGVPPDAQLLARLLAASRTQQTP